jgi:DNA-binding SARP family transcriptional activator
VAKSRQQREGVRETVVRVSVLGPVTAWQGEHEISPGQPRQRAVLGVLATRANRVVSRSELVDAVWGHQSPASAEGGIYTYVAGLRRILEPDRPRRDPGRVLVSAGAGYMLRLGPDALDAVVFERDLGQARKLRAQGDLSASANMLDHALGLWRGMAFAGVPGPFADAERQRLAELRTAAAEERADVFIALGRHEEALPDLTVLVAEHPMRERSRGLLMIALYRCGRQAEALQAYRDARDALAEELGIDPGSELSRIHQQVLAMDPALDPPKAAVTAAAAAGQGTEGREDGIPAQVPLEISGFTGRQSELGRLHSMLPGTAGTTIPVAVITGMAGIGKTALAIRFARQVLPQFPDGQLYVNLRGFDPSGLPLQPGDVLRRFCDALGVPPKRVPDAIEAQVGLFRSLLDGKRMLLVLDNARTTEQVRPLLPGSPGCMVLITSRSQLTGLVAAEGARPLPLDVLTHDEARQVLDLRLGADRTAAEETAAAELIRLCARLPLALSVISARAATQPGLGLADLAAELHDGQARLDLLDAGDEATTNVRAVFFWSYQQLCEKTARMFRLLGTQSSTDISPGAAGSLADIPLEEARAALAELTRASLLSEPVVGRYAFHDLLRAYAAEQARATESAADLEAAQLRLLDHYLRTAHAATLRVRPERQPPELPAPVPGAIEVTFRAYEQALSWMTVEQHSLLSALDDAAGRPGLEVYCWQLAWQISPLFVRNGRWREYRRAEQIALAAAEQLGDKVALVYGHRDLGYACLLMDDVAEADKHLAIALDQVTELGNHQLEAFVRNAMVLLYEKQERFAEALTHALEALRLGRAYATRPAIANAENAVGWMYAKMGQFSEALRHCRRSLELNRDTGNRMLTADVLDSLGFIYNGLGDYDHAITSYLQALAIYREVGDSNCIISALTGLGDAKLAAGQPAQARESWERALAAGYQLPAFDPGPLRKRLDEVAVAGPGDEPGGEPGEDVHGAVITAR